MVGMHQHDKGKEFMLSVSNRTVIRVLLLVLGSVIALASLRRAEHAIVLIFTALFLSVALNAPVHWLAVRIPGKRRGSRMAGTAISFLIVMAFLIGFIASIGPPLVRQTDSFISAAPHLVQEARNQNGAFGSFVRKYHLESQVNSFATQLGSRLKNASGSAIGTIGKIGSSIFSVLTILVLTFMMLIEGPHWLRIFEDIVPNHYHRHLERLMADMYRVVKGYVNGQVFLAALASCLIAPILFILHVSYPVALVVVIFVCGLIPLVGHTIGAVIVSVVALFHSLPTAVLVLAYYILYQQIETYIIQPRVQANSTNMSPLLVFASVVVGVNFGGLFGGLVAIPIAGCLRVALLDYLLNRHILNEKALAVIEADRSELV